MKEFNPNLLELVKDKRVVLVGPASSLVDQNLGEYFDSFDVVCRINKHAVPYELRGDYGNRTDIFFKTFDLIIPDTEKIVYEINQYPKEWKNIKLVCSMAHVLKRNNRQMPSWQGRAHRLEHRFRAINRDCGHTNHKLNYYQLEWEKYHKIFQDVCRMKTMGLWGQTPTCEPTQGVFAFSLLAQYPIKELHVAGYTFYNHPTRFDKTYHDNHGGGRAQGHGLTCSNQQLDYFMGIIDKSKINITTDKKLANIMRRRKELIRISANRSARKEYR